MSGLNSEFDSEESESSLSPSPPSPPSLSLLLDESDSESSFESESSLSVLPAVILKNHTQKCGLPAYKTKKLIEKKPSHYKAWVLRKPRGRKRTSGKG